MTKIEGNIDKKNGTNILTKQIFTVVSTVAAAEAAAVAAAVAAAPAAASVPEERNPWTLNVISFLVFVNLLLHMGVGPTPSKIMAGGFKIELRRTPGRHFLSP